MQQQRVNTPPVPFDGAVFVKDLCYNGNVIGWLANEINRLFQPESPPECAVTIQHSTLAGRACLPHIPTSFHEQNRSFMLAVEDVTTMFGP
jgi:hypothetical protein